MLVHPDLVPGGQPLNVRREHVLSGDGNPHPENRLHDQRVRAGRPGPVDRPDLEGEVVHADCGLRIADCEWETPTGEFTSAVRNPKSTLRPAYGMSNSNSLMSHAAVGHRSAHRPQCRQTSSSFTMTRCVCGSAAET